MLHVGGALNFENQLRVHQVNGIKYSHAIHSHMPVWVQMHLQGQLFSLFGGDVNFISGVLSQTIMVDWGQPHRIHVDDPWEGHEAEQQEQHWHYSWLVSLVLCITWTHNRQLLGRDNEQHAKLNQNILEPNWQTGKLLSSHNTTVRICFWILIQICPPLFQLFHNFSNQVILSLKINILYFRKTDNKRKQHAQLVSTLTGVNTCVFLFFCQHEEHGVLMVDQISVR